MSAYINGFKLKENLSTYEMFSFFDNLREEANMLAIKDLNEKVAKVISDIYDRIEMKEEKSKVFANYWDRLNEKVSFRALVRHLIQKDSNSISIYDDEFSYEFNIMIYPLKDKILFIPFYTNSIFNKLFEDKESFENYKYTSYSDDTFGLSNREYNKVKADWDSIFNKTNKYDVGLSFKVIDIDNLHMKYKDEEVLNIINSLFDERVYNIAKSLVISSCVKDENLGFNEMLKEIRTYTKTDEYKENIKLKKDEISKILIKDFTLDMINKHKV